MPSIKDAYRKCVAYVMDESRHLVTHEELCKILQEDFGIHIAVDELDRIAEQSNVPDTLRYGPEFWDMRAVIYLVDDSAAVHAWLKAYKW